MVWNMISCQKKKSQETVGMLQCNRNGDQLQSLSWPQNNLFQMETPWRLLCHVIQSSSSAGAQKKERKKKKQAFPVHIQYTVSAQGNMCGMKKRAFIE